MLTTGVDAFDRLAEDSPAELQEFLAEVRAGAWIVEATDKLPSGVVAYFFPRKGCFQAALLLDGRRSAVGAGCAGDRGRRSPAQPAPTRAAELVPVRQGPGRAPASRKALYHPGRMSILDLWHEAEHLELFERRGNRKTGAGQGERDEIEAYQFEYDLGGQHGFSEAYIRYPERQLAFYRIRLEGPEPPRPSRMPDSFMKRSGPPHRGGQGRQERSPGPGSYHAKLNSNQ